MSLASKPYFGYEVRIPAGVRHRGLTTDPEGTLEEYRERLGPAAMMQLLTPPMSYREARQWDEMLKRNRQPALNSALGWGGIAPSTPALRR